MFGPNAFGGEPPEDGEAMDAYQRAAFFAAMVIFTTALLLWERFAVAQ